MEEKAKAYDEAIKKAKKLYEQGTITESLNYVFPELKESKDERIRKALLELVHDTTGDELWVDYNVHKEDALAWLEKQGEKDNFIEKELECIKGYRENAIKRLKELEQQGEQKEYTFKSLPRLLDMIEPTSKAKAYVRKLIDTLVKEGYAADAKIVGECLKQMNGEKVALATMDEKQAPKWSKEDEYHWMMCLECVEECATQKREDFSKTIDWLKSIKQMLEGE